jgi:hypothetical protein
MRGRHGPWGPRNPAGGFATHLRRTSVIGLSLLMSESRPRAPKTRHEKSPPGVFELVTPCERDILATFSGGEVAHEIAQLGRHERHERLRAAVAVVTMNDFN